ncbi:MAG: threonine/serine dehydratase [Acidobacteriota bacterium]
MTKAQSPEPEARSPEPEADSAAQFVTLADIQAAADRIRPAARVTPLVEAQWPAWPGADGGARVADRSIFLKCENFQPMGAFKMRGAVNMLARLPAEALRRGVITYSSGNHGQAVALAARMLGAPAVIVMPTTAPTVKVEGVKSYGAEAVFAGTTSRDRQARAEELAAERGLTIVPPFDHPWIIEGQGTTGLEILDQCPDVAAVVVGVGGGGLASGLATAIKARKPEVRIIGVEPEGAPKMTRSLAAGHPIVLESSASIADGLMNVRPGDLTFAHVRRFVDEVVTVADPVIERAVQWLFRRAKIVAEPSGAINVAAVALGLGGVREVNGPVVAIVSGGNVEPALFARLITA